MKKIIFCEICGAKIPLERVKILPDTTTCVKCSQTEPYSRDSILGLEVFEEQERNPLNVEDFEGSDNESSHYYNDDWQEDG